MGEHDQVLAWGVLIYGEAFAPFSSIPNGRGFIRPSPKPPVFPCSLPKGFLLLHWAEEQTRLLVGPPGKETVYPGEVFENQFAVIFDQRVRGDLANQVRHLVPRVTNQPVSEGDEWLVACMEKPGSLVATRDNSLMLISWSKLAYNLMLSRLSRSSSNCVSLFQVQR